MTLFSFLKGFIDVPLFKNKTSMATLLFSELFLLAHFSRHFRNFARKFCDDSNKIKSRILKPN
ncbi:hypothetical protein MtrunA17_Chr3g0099711 [Medicago truncatula]|uniref:Transmembrane protein n=1 Tax=Medicago truncatula TaxID=3880 RepID=A0A396IND5_MEDTR|nr:hypothetical protein MtrunA17_Chr3g0099711 [Medicago truncatula]